MSYNKSLKFQSNVQYDSNIQESKSAIRLGKSSTWDERLIIAKSSFRARVQPQPY